jgi:hypothetical protein
MERFPSEMKEESIKKQQDAFRRAARVTDNTQETPSPGSPGMRILSRYSVTINNLMKVVGVE